MEVKASTARARTPRVLQLGPLYVGHLRRWAEHASALGCTVYAAGHVRPDRRLTDLTDVAECVEVAPESLLRLGTAPHVAWLRDLLRRLQPDLVHAHWLPTWAYFATLEGSRPLAVTPWGSDIYLATGAMRRRADRALRGADRVLARSLHMRRELIARGAPPDSTYDVDLGVNIERFRPPSPGERARLRHELGLPEGPVILSVRAGTPLYNLDVVLDAFRVLRTRLRDATLVLAHGDAPLCQRVRESMRGVGARDGVLVAGAVPHGDMSKYLRAASVGVSIPSSDGSPNSVWEALACGLPMVLSDLPQIQERVDGHDAVRLVAPDANAVAAALVEVLTNGRREQMAAAARAWAVANVDEREQVARLAEVYGSLEWQAAAQARMAA